MTGEGITDPTLTPHHPRLRHQLHGQQAAEQHLLQAYKSGRCHHAWLLAGPRGVGKATLAYRFARFVLAYPDAASAGQAIDLDVDPDHPAAQRVASRGHADLLVLERPLDEKTGRVKPAIDVETARRATGFFSHTSGEGGWRVCIVDAADDLNSNAANALLKIIEEPPSRCLFVLVSHAPGRLLATIRSRCIRLDLGPLDQAAFTRVLAETAGIDEDRAAELHQISAGSAGRALELIESGASEKFETFRSIAERGRPFDRKAIWALSSQMAQKANEEEFRLFCELLEQWTMMRARDAVGANALSEATLWAEQVRDLSHSIRQANALNLDRRELLLNAFESIEGISHPLNHPGSA